MNMLLLLCLYIIKKLLNYGEINLTFLYRCNLFSPNRRDKYAGNTPICILSVMVTSDRNNTVSILDIVYFQFTLSST